MKKAKVFFSQRMHTEYDLTTLILPYFVQNLAQFGYSYILISLVQIKQSHNYALIILWYFFEFS